jgi:hypothetical protein
MSATSASFSATRRSVNGNQQIRSLETTSFQAPDATRNRRWLKLPSVNFTLADPVKGFGPCLDDEEETQCSGLVSGATLQSFSPLARGVGEIQLGWTLCSSEVCARSLVLRTYNRTATDALREACPRSLSPLWAGRLGERTGNWDVAQNHTRRTQVSSKLPCWTFPLAGPDEPVSFPRVSIRGAGDAC